MPVSMDREINNLADDLCLSYKDEMCKELFNEAGHQSSSSLTVSRATDIAALIIDQHSRDFTQGVLKKLNADPLTQYSPGSDTYDTVEYYSGQFYKKKIGTIAFREKMATIMVTGTDSDKSSDEESVTQ